MKNWTALLMMLCIAVSSATAQRVELSGQAFAFKQLKLANVKVTSLKTKTSTVTDSEGKFTLLVKKPKDILLVEADGFEPLKINTRNQSSVYAKLTLQAFGANAAVKAGHATKKDLEYAQDKHWDYNNSYASYPDISRLLYGEFGDKIVVRERNGSVKAQLSGRDGNNLTFKADRKQDLPFFVNGVMMKDIGFLKPSDIYRIEFIDQSDLKRPIKIYRSPETTNSTTVLDMPESGKYIMIDLIKS